ncbi:MAG: cytochrome c [Campylobacterota bacterium]|nr:cytochrome c [Campylobacterota bacterium]
MSKKLIFIGAFLICSSLFGDSREKGKEIFLSYDCKMCHQDKAETVGPSLDKIGMFYSGKENDLVSYLKGQKKAIIYPERAAAMDPQLIKIRHLMDDEVRALARYLSTAYNYREDM